jgi:hypothetical protein
VPESEASGDSRLEVPVDTDRLDTGMPDGEPAEQEFEYLLDEVDELDGAEPLTDPATDPDGLGPDAVGPDWVELTPDPALVTDRFDAFDANTWHFKPAPKPWYQTRQAVVGIALVAFAAVALVVAVVLLAIRGSSDDVPALPTSTTGTTDPPTTVTASSELPPPPVLPPPPPPPVPPPPTAQSGPAYYPPRTQARPTKKPQQNVTRTPISVAPQPRGHG